jgi:hypothetical protein
LITTLRKVKSLLSGTIVLNIKNDSVIEFHVIIKLDIKKYTIHYLS